MRLNKTFKKFSLYRKMLIYATIKYIGDVIISIIFIRFKADDEISDAHRQKNDTSLERSSIFIRAFIKK